MPDFHHVLDRLLTSSTIPFHATAGINLIGGAGARVDGRFYLGRIQAIADADDHLGQTLIPGFL